MLSQYITKGLERWNLSTDVDIERKYVYLEWKEFVENQKRFRPNDKSLQYSESEFTKHNHLCVPGKRNHSLGSVCHSGIDLGPFQPFASSYPLCRRVTNSPLSEST